MSHDLQLVTSRQFNGITLNCYRDGQNDPQDFWAPREQIGQLLGYKHPNDSIASIHTRNKERLNKFSSSINSSSIKMIDNQKNRTITRDVIVYNFKGLLEICRYSNQPNAHKVIDVLWDIADEIRRTGSYSVNIPTLVKNLQNENALLRKKVDSLIEQVNATRSFAVLGQAVTVMSGTLSSAEAAKMFAQKGFDIGQNRLLKLGREKNILCKRKGRQWNQPTQKGIEKGYVNIVINFGAKGTTVWTPKGLQFISDWLVDQKYPLLALIEDGEAVNA